MQKPHCGIKPQCGCSIVTEVSDLVALGGPGDLGGGVIESPHDGADDRL
jgi:hypothetical protein